MVDWKTSAAKVVLEDDLREGVLPVDAKEMPPREAWNTVYEHLLEFHGVEYEQFRDNLNRMRKRHKKKKTNV